MNEQTEIAEIASELALAIHDVASALQASAWALVYLTSGDDAELLVERIRGVAGRAYNIAYALQRTPPSVAPNERSVLASASYIADAVSVAAEGLKAAAWVAVRLGGDEDARPLMETLTEAARLAMEYYWTLWTRLSALPHPGEEVE